MPKPRLVPIVFLKNVVSTEPRQPWQGHRSTAFDHDLSGLQGKFLTRGRPLLSQHARTTELRPRLDIDTIYLSQPSGGPIGYDIAKASGALNHLPIRLVWDDRVESAAGVCRKVFGRDHGRHATYHYDISCHLLIPYTHQKGPMPGGPVGYVEELVTSPHEELRAIARDASPQDMFQPFFIWPDQKASSHSLLETITDPEPIIAAYCKLNCWTPRFSIVAPIRI